MIKALLLIDNDGRELITGPDPYRPDGTHFCFIELPAGSIRKITGRTLNHKDQPVELETLNLKLFKYGRL